MARLEPLLAAKVCFLTSTGCAKVGVAQTGAFGFESFHESQLIQPLNKTGFMNDEQLSQDGVDAAEDNRVVPKQYLVPFILVTTLFALWGFANSFTDPMVKVFKDVFAISNGQSAFVQMAFYGGYATMAIPAALFIRKFSYKAGILMGLALFATGAMLSIPAANNVNFWLFISGIYILTFGLAFLETTANPFILSMGSEKTSTLRLNLAQAFNPVGLLAGAFRSGQFRHDQRTSR